MFKKICYCFRHIKCILKIQTTNDCSSIFERLDTRSNTKLSVAIQTKQMAQKLENATSSMVLRAQVIFRNPRKDATTCIRMKISETFFCCANHILFSDGKFRKFEKKQRKKVLLDHFVAQKTAAESHCLFVETYGEHVLLKRNGNRKWVPHQLNEKQMEK